MYIYMENDLKFIRKYNNLYFVYKDLTYRDTNWIKKCNPAIRVSDKVERLKTIDLTCPITVKIPKSEISVEVFDRIAAATNTDSFILFDHATKLLNTLKSSTMSLLLLRQVLYTNSFKRGFDFILYFDVAFIEATTRYLLDFIYSPNNPLSRRKVFKRKVATYFIIYIDNQLFMLDNYLVQLAWLEGKCFSIDKTQWDGGVVKVDNRSFSAGLIEFSGGYHNKPPSSRNQYDITKLYSKMIKTLKKHPPDTTKEAFCLRYCNNDLGDLVSKIFLFCFFDYNILFWQASCCLSKMLWVCSFC
ncbi:hypothetical protein F4703DRAFT_1790292 [Phycomyces blakesleeanus]